MNWTDREITQWVQRLEETEAAIKQGTFQGDKDKLILNLIDYTKTSLNQFKKSRRQAL